MTSKFTQPTQIARLKAALKPFANFINEIEETEPNDKQVVFTVRVGDIRFAANLLRKFTFRKEKKATGLEAVGRPRPDTVIKLNKMMVGSIVAPFWMSDEHVWKIRFMVKNGNSFDWITLKAKFNEESEARVWLNHNFKLITDKYDLYSMEDER